MLQMKATFASKESFIIRVKIAWEQEIFQKSTYKQIIPLTIPAN